MYPLHIHWSPSTANNISTRYLVFFLCLEFIQILTRFCTDKPMTKSKYPRFIHALSHDKSAQNFGIESHLKRYDWKRVKPYTATLSDAGSIWTDWLCIGCLSQWAEVWRFKLAWIFCKSLSKPGKISVTTCSSMNYFTQCRLLEWSSNQNLLHEFHSL